VIAEIALRWMDGSRHLFWSTGHFISDGSGAVRYKPSEAVRSAAIYNGSIEYDVKFHTNNMGLIDGRDYPYEHTAKHRYAFVGDSFTAGIHGGAPWVPALRDHLTDEQSVGIYNLGVSGTGVMHFKVLLQSVGRHLSFSDIVILVISDDFYRPHWHPVVNRNRIYFCLGDESDRACSDIDHHPTAYIMDFGSTAEQLLDYDRRISDQERKKERAGYGAAVYQSWQLYRLAKHVYSKMLMYWDNDFGQMMQEQRRQQDVQRNSIYQRNMDALREIGEQYKSARVYLLHIPEKHEVANGRYSLQLGDAATAAGMEYHALLNECAWNTTMFYERDQHPNSSGYENLSSCVRNVLGL